MKNFDYTANDDMPLLDSELPKQSLMQKIRSRLPHLHIPSIRKTKPVDMPDTPEPLLDENESAELKQMIDSLTSSTAKPYTIPKIVTDLSTPSSQPLPIPTPAPVSKLHRFANTIIAVIALIGGLYGVMVLYNQFPTHPTIIVGIVAIAASTGVITGISARG